MIIGMPRHMEQLQFHLLDLLAESGSPEGAGSLLGRLAGRGLQASQATLGRALRVLDGKGYTIRLTNKGRIPTVEGRHWLADTRYRQETRRWTHETLMAVGQSTLTELQRAMVARRALEPAIARLAAENASPAEIAELGRIVEWQRDDLAGGGGGAQQAVAFHVALAGACGNRFLAAAADLVRTSSEALEKLMYHLGATVGGSHHEHLELVSAIAARDPRAAEHAMEMHLDELIRDVDRWLAQLANGVAMTGAPAAARSTNKSVSNGSGDDRTARPDNGEPAQHLAGASAPASNQKEGRHNG